MLTSLICRKNKKISQRWWINEFHHDFMGRIGNTLTSWSSLSPTSRSSRATTFPTSTSSSTWQNTIDQGGKGQNPRWDVVMSSHQEINDSVIHHVHPKSRGKSVTREKDGFLPQLNLWFRGLWFRGLNVVSFREIQAQFPPKSASSLSKPLPLKQFWSFHTGNIKKADSDT